MKYIYVWGLPQPEELALKGHSSRNVENHSDYKPKWSVVTPSTRAPGTSEVFLCGEMENTLCASFLWEQYFPHGKGRAQEARVTSSFYDNHFSAWRM